MNANNEMFKLEPVKQVALDRALQLLRAAGVQFGILMPDGSMLGDLQVVKPKKERPAKFRQTGYDYTPIYKHVFDTLNPGDSYMFELPADAPPEITTTRLSSALSGSGSFRWGKGSCIVRQVPGTRKVEFLRVY